MGASSPRTLFCNLHVVSRASYNVQGRVTAPLVSWVCKSAGQEHDRHGPGWRARRPVSGIAPGIRCRDILFDICLDFGWSNVEDMS